MQPGGDLRRRPALRAEAEIDVFLEAAEKQVDRDADHRTPRAGRERQVADAEGRDAERKIIEKSFFLRAFLFESLLFDRRRNMYQFVVIGHFLMILQSL